MQITKRAWDSRDSHKAKNQGCCMAHVGYAMSGDLGNIWLLCIAVVVEEDVGSRGDGKANACQQQQGAACFVEHGVKLLVLVLCTSQQETTACTQHSTLAISLSLVITAAKHKCSINACAEQQL